MLATGSTRIATDPSELAAMASAREASTSRAGSGEASMRSRLPRSCSVRAVPSSPCAVIHASVQSMGMVAAVGARRSALVLQAHQPRGDRPG